MSVKIHLDKLAEEIDAKPDLGFTYLNKQTGEVVYIQEEYFTMAEEDEHIDDLHDWERDMVREAKEILETDDYISLPGDFEINEWEMMRDFCGTIGNPEKKDKLLYLIRGKGAFRLFKDAIYDFGIEDEWFLFKHESMKEIARRWCEEHGLDYYEENLEWVVKYKKKIEEKGQKEPTDTDFDREKVDEVVLVLLHLTSFKQGEAIRAWKGLDWDALNRLHEKGFISNPRGKAKSVVLTEEGAKLSQELFNKYFGK